MVALDTLARSAGAKATGARGDSMQLLSNTVRSASLAALSLSLLGGAALATDNKIAVAPGGPHPYFAPWEQAAADAKKDFGIADVEYKVPTDWKLELQT